MIYKLWCDPRSGIWCVMLETIAAGEWTRVFSATTKATCQSWIQEQESRSIDQLERIEKILLVDGVQASLAYCHGNDAAGPEIRGLWDAYQIVHEIRTTWIESIK